MAMMPKTRLAALILLASAIQTSAQTGDPVAGEDAYVANCMKCHASAARIVRKIDGDTAEEKGAWLDGFLADHHLSDTGVKADLIIYLVNL